MTFHKLGLLFLLPLYDKIQSLCDTHRMTITELCRRLDIPRSVLSELKSGRTKSINTKYLTRIAEFFSVSVDYLIGNEKLPVILSDSGQKEYDEIFNQLSPENQSKWLELGRLYLDAQRNSGKN